MSVSEFDLTESELLDAIAQQRPYVRHLLGTRRWETEDLMAQVAFEVLDSLPRWERAGRPVLGAWARRVARIAYLEWTRSPGSGRARDGSRTESLEELGEYGVELVEEPPEPMTSRRAARIRLAALIEQALLAEPGGAAAWARLLTPEGQPRGQRARRRLCALAQQVDPDGDLHRQAGLPEPTPIAMSA